MGFWKVLGGAATGFLVGGPVGAIIGGAAGAGVSIAKGIKDDNEKKDEIRNSAYNAEREIARLQEEREELQKALKGKSEKSKKRYEKSENEYLKVRSEINDQDPEQNVQLLIATSAIGFATANADGSISKDELRELANFIHSFNPGKLPNSLAEKIIQYKNEPPELEEAIKEINLLPVFDYSLFRKEIELIISADGTPNEAEQKLLKRFDKLTAKEHKNA